MISVLVCDDDAFVRGGLAGCIAETDDLEVAASVGTAEEALEVLARRAIDVVLMDLNLPGMDGIEAVRRLRARAAADEDHGDTDGTEVRSPAVLMLTAFGSDDQVREALAAGACGFLLKTAGHDALTASIRAASQRSVTLLSPELVGPAVGPSVGSSVGPGAISGPGGAASGGADATGDGAPEDLLARRAALGLSRRETQVLSLVCTGLSNAGVAAALEITDSTVKTHVSSLLTKLDADSRLDLALRAFGLGLAAPPRSGRSSGM
ncbi:response regulator transcription factor [Brachybacterium sp. DNPG3]